MDVLVPHRTRPWTSLRFGHGCSARTDGVGVHVSVVRAETLCENTGRRDVFCARSARHTVNTCSRSPQGLILAKPRKHRQARGFRRRTRRNAVNTDALVYRSLLPETMHTSLHLSPGLKSQGLCSEYLVAAILPGMLRISLLILSLAPVLSSGRAWEQ